MANDLEVLFIIEEAEEGGFVARGVGVGIITEGDTLDELRANVREAVECHFDEGQSPRIVRLPLPRCGSNWNAAGNFG
jgi:predicted RNase H-like HicB family nuclease